MQLYDDTLIKQVVEKNDLADDAVRFALTYFSYYFHNPVLGQLTAENIPQYVREFQVMIGTTPDGALDAKVVKALRTMPRCGCRDYSLISPEAFGTAPRWGLKEVTYWVERYVTGLSNTDQDDLMQQAFDAWSAVADIKFKRVMNQSGANIIISTGQGSKDNFDGPSGTLAWAYLPPQVNFQGQLLMRFDLDETWVNNPSNRGIMYLNVATHEFGHLCGLEHSKMPTALMAPYYNVNIKNPQLSDDVPRIQALYGAASDPTPTPTPPVAPTPTPTPTTPPVGGRIKVEITVDSMDDIKINGKAATDFDLI